MDEFQEISAPRPRGGDELDDEPRIHRACPPDIKKGYAVVGSPPMPLSPQRVPWGKYNIRVEAMTQGGKRIFCVEAQGSFDIMTYAEAWRLHITSAPEPFASAVKSGYRDQYRFGQLLGRHLRLMWVRKK